MGESIMNNKRSRRKVLRLGLGVAVMGVGGNLVSDTKSEQAPDSEEAKMKSKEIETKKIKLADRIMDVVIERIDAFTVMGLTYRNTNPSGGGDVGKGLLEDFAEEAAYYGINTDITYAVTAEPSFVVRAKTWPPARFCFYFTYGVAIDQEHLKSVPFVFCLRRIPAGKYARLTVSDAETGAAYQAFDAKNWDGDGPKPNWALSFQRSPSRFAKATGEPPKQDFYVSLGASRDFILH